MLDMLVESDVPDSRVVEELRAFLATRGREHLSDWLGNVESCHVVQLPHRAAAPPSGTDEDDEEAEANGVRHAYVRVGDPLPMNRTGEFRIHRNWILHMAARSSGDGLDIWWME